MANNNMQDFEFNKFVDMALPHYMSRTLATALLNLRFSNKTTDDIELNMLLEDAEDTGVKITEHYKKLVRKMLAKIVHDFGSKAAALQILKLGEDHAKELELILVIRKANLV